VNILITGSGGFLGKEFIEYFDKSRHKITSFTRQELDITDRDEVRKALQEGNYSVIINTAFIGGNRQDLDTFNDFVDNLSGFRILAEEKDPSTLMFCFGSGAAYNRNLSVRDVKEAEMGLRHPGDFYGLAKNLISKEIYNYRNIVEFILFGCFSKSEMKTRFMQACLNAVSPMILAEDKFMDFFYIKDLFKVVDHYIDNYSEGGLPKTLNMSYKEKPSLLEIGKKLRPNLDFVLHNELDVKYYSGNGSKLASLPIKLMGTFAGIDDMLKGIE
jgi:UDP-glucose 4-epimerase